MPGLDEQIETASRPDHLAEIVAAIAGADVRREDTVARELHALRTATITLETLVDRYGRLPLSALPGPEPVFDATVGDLGAEKLWPGGEPERIREAAETRTPAEADAGQFPGLAEREGCE